MAFRMMRYAVAAMQNHLDAGNKRCRWWFRYFLPWRCQPVPFSLCWLDEFDDPETARQFYSATFPLVDITVVSDDEIMQHRRVALLELVQKHIRERDLMVLVDKLVALLIKGRANDSQVETLFNYWCSLAAHRVLRRLFEKVALRVPQHKRD